MDFRFDINTKSTNSSTHLSSGTWQASMKVTFMTLLVLYILYTQSRRNVTKMVTFVKRMKAESRKEFRVRIRKRIIKKTHDRNGNWMILLLLTCGDIESNPGPPTIENGEFYPNVLVCCFF